MCQNSCVLELSQDWFLPARLYARGYPQGMTSALRMLPDVRAELAEQVLALGSSRALEVGPGDAPLLQGHPAPVYLDVSSMFLASLEGRRVQGDVLAAPFLDRAFDLVVTADVLTHVSPPRRVRALAELRRVARAVLLFVPERGLDQVSGSSLDAAAIVRFFMAQGSTTSSRRLVARHAGGAYPMSIIHAVHP